MLQLDVWSDIACPWCYLGKRRLAAALKAAGLEAEVEWHAFELDPTMPADGLPSVEYYARKFGGPGRWEATWQRMATFGRADGITFAFERLERAPNTRLAHRATRIARELGGAAAQDAAVEACFRAHFSDGVNISDREALLGVLADVPIDQTKLREQLATDAGLAHVVADERAAAQLGITGVPVFVAGGKLALSGAQPPDVFAAYLAEARQL